MPKTNSAYAPVLLTALLLNSACASSKKSDPDLEASGDELADETNAEDNSQGKKSTRNSATKANNASKNSVKEDSEDAPEKQPIADDGYDDDWNNLANQQQQNQKAKNNQNSQNVQNGQSLAELPQQNAQANKSPNEILKNSAPNAPAQNVPVEPPFTEEVPAPPPALPAAAKPEVPLAEQVASLPKDIEPVSSRLIWVGYDFLEKEGLLRIEMVTRGHPKFDLLQERNLANQPELIVRFFATELRSKIRRDIDASEFRSPVAFVRLRPDKGAGTVDVVMTLRDGVQPRLYTRAGNVMLTFPLPDRYFGNSGIGASPLAHAEVMPNANVMPLVDVGSELPESGKPRPRDHLPGGNPKLAKAFVPDPGKDAFQNAPKDGGQLAPVPMPVSNPPEPAAPVSGASQPANTAAQVPPNLEPASEVAPVAPPVASQTQSKPLPVRIAPRKAMQGPPADVEGIDFGTAPAAAGVNEFSGVDTGSAFPMPQSTPPAGAPSGPQVDAEFDQQELDDDKLDNFDDGKGESVNEIDKFDVRLRPSRQSGRALAGAYVVTEFSLVAVAADNLAVNNAGNAANSDPGEQALDGDLTSGEADFPGANNQAQGPANVSSGNSTGAPINAAQPVNGGFSLTSPSNEAKAGAEPASLGSPNVPTLNASAPAGTGALPGGAAPANNAAALAPALTPVVDQGAPKPGEPPLEGSPDLTGKEQEGAENEEGPAPVSAGGRPMKLDFRDAPLTEVIRVLSEESRVNFIITPEVGSKKVSLNLQGVPFNDALKAILEANALGMVPIGPSIVRIDTLQALAADKEAEERRRKAELKLKPTKIMVYRLSYAKADDAAKMLGQMLASANKEDSRIVVQTDQRTNALIINAPPNDLSTIKALLERIDLETPQVKIATRIVQVVKSFTDSFGLNWNPMFNFDPGRGLGFGSLVFPNNMTSKFSIDAGGTADSATRAQFRFGSINNSMTLDLALAMEETLGTTQILQSNNIIVVDNETATITSGKTDYIPNVGGGVVVGGNGASGPSAVNYNLSLNVTPHVTADGAVDMLLDIQDDTPAATPEAKGAVASVNTRHLKNRMLRRSGETVAIGGVYSTEQFNQRTGVPFLSSLPIIGALFRQSVTKDGKNELVVMVTPTILSNVKQVAADGTASPNSAGLTDVASPSSKSNLAAGDNANFDGNSASLGEQSNTNSNTSGKSAAANGLTNANANENGNIALNNTKNANGNRGGEANETSDFDGDSGAETVLNSGNANQGANANVQAVSNEAGNDE